MDAAALAGIHDLVADYYTGRVRRHGATPLGVDWTSVVSQELRFVQLLKLCDFSAPFSLNDLGCGYGAVLAYLARRHADTPISYLGIDLSQDMLDHARSLWAKRPDTRFALKQPVIPAADYTIASGIFNVKLDQQRAPWEAYISVTLDEMDAASARGFAFNFMIERPEDIGQSGPLYRCDPTIWASFCEERFEGEVFLLEDYGQPEATILVRR